MPLNEDPDRQWVEIRLPNHGADDYADILTSDEHIVPDSWSYNVASAMDIDEDLGAPEAAERGQTAEAWIDFPGQYAVVGLNPAFYADTPKDELTEVAEDILLEWATYYRQRLGPQAEDDTGPASREEVTDNHTIEQANRLSPGRERK